MDKTWLSSEKMRKPLYCDAPFVLLLEFSQDKNMYTLWRNKLVKIRLELSNKLYCRRFGTKTFFKTSLLSH